MLRILLLALPLILAAAPPGSDPESDATRFYRSLKTRDGTSCCSLADCRPTLYRQTAGGYEVLIDERYGVSPGKWVKLPEDKLIRNVVNPTGFMVVCYIPERGVLCAVMPSET